MRIFQTTYKGRDGKRRKASRWYVEFRDHRGIVRRLPGFADRKSSEALGRTVEKLAACRGSGDPLTAELRQWVETLPGRIVKPMARWGLLDKAKTTAGRTLLVHLEGETGAPGWRQHLEGKGTTTKQVRLVVGRVRRIVQGCGFTFWSDVDAGKVSAFLHDLRADRKDAGGTVKRGASAQTSNFYLTAFKSFCKWMLLDGRVHRNPVAHLQGLNVKTDRRHDRRALEPEEIRWLLDVTAGEPIRCKASGSERAVLYRVAAESGLRAAELASLTAASFDFAADPPTVCVEAAYSKHRRRDEVPLRPDTARLLAEHLGPKLPGAQAFIVPKRTAEVFRADLTAARRAWIADGANEEERTERERSCFLAYRDDGGLYADFHSLRHATGSMLAASGAHPKVAQSIMRHSTVELTLGRYSHLYRGQDADAVNALPDLGQAPAGQRALATGTFDTKATDVPGSATRGADGEGRRSGRRKGANATAGCAETADDTASMIRSNTDVNASPLVADERLALCLARQGGSCRISVDDAGRNGDTTDSPKTPVNTGESAVFQGETENRWDGRVDEGGGLENRCGESHRGFESLSHRSPP